MIVLDCTTIINRCINKSAIKWNILIAFLQFIQFQLFNNLRVVVHNNWQHLSIVSLLMYSSILRSLLRYMFKPVRLLIIWLEPVSSTWNWSLMNLNVRKCIQNFYRFYYNFHEIWNTRKTRVITIFCCSRNIDETLSILLVFWNE